MAYELGHMRTDRGLFIDKGNWGIDPRHPDFSGGASGDGIKNDRPAFADADAYAVANGALVLIVGPGTYKIDTDITLQSKVWLAEGASFAGAGTVTYSHWNPIRGTNYFTPEMYGAVGDGVADDYQAWYDLSEAVSDVDAAIVECRPGAHYLIDRYYDVGNGNTDAFIWSGLTSLVIRGNGAKVEMDGTFHREADTDLGGGQFQGNAHVIIPLYIQNCDNIRIENLEIDGNVEHTTRESGVIETAGYGIRIHDSDNYILENLDVHHFQTDGILLGDSTPMRRGALINVRTRNNARQGLSVIAVKDLVCIDCSFEETGTDIGTYGAHAPGGGVDIEPDGGEEKASNISFLRCLFKNNVVQFYASYPSSVHNVTCRDCEFTTDDSTVTYQVFAAAKGVHFDNCIFNLDAGYIQIGYAAASPVADQWVTIRNSRVYSSGNGILTDGNIRAELENVEMIGTHTEASADYMPYLQNNKMVVRNCRVYRPTESYNGAGSYQVACLWEVKDSIANEFETDLDLGTEGAGAHFAVSYGAATRVRGDTFLPTSNRSFRPSFDSAHSAGVKFDDGDPEVGKIETISLGGTHNNLVLGAYTKILRVTFTSNATVTGIAGGTHGRRVLVQNTDTGVRTLTFTHADAGSSVGNKMAAPGAASYVLDPGEGVIVWKDGISDVWRILASN